MFPGFGKAPSGRTFLRQVQHKIHVRVNLAHDEVVAVEQLGESRRGNVGGDCAVEGRHAGRMERNQLACL